MHWAELRKPFIFLVVLLVPYLIRAQEPERLPRRGSRIIDDTTRQVYGPQTSRVFGFTDLFYERWETRPVDTVIRDFHRMGPVERSLYTLQDLGNIGTAVRPVYPQVTDRIGVHPGFDAYDVYWKETIPNYFNTRSPYSNMHVILGGRGRSLTSVTYSRNINPRLNFGFDYHGLFIDKQVQRQGKGDRNVKNNTYDIFMSYHSKDSSYALLADFRRMYHRVFEYGGVRLPGDYIISDMFALNAQPWLANAESNDFRINYHLYHQYRVGRGLQVYHRLESYRQRNRYIDNNPGNPFYDTVFISTQNTFDQVKFRALRNEAGIKGRAGVFFYNGFFALRSFAVDYLHLNEQFLDFPETSGTEFYTGGEVILPLPKLGTLSGKLNWMFDNRYYFIANLNTHWLVASLSRSVYTPGFVQQAYRGNHNTWLNNFSETEASELKGNLIIQTKRFSLYPGLSLNTYRNLIFFRDGFMGSQRMLPVQTDGYQTVVLPQLRISVEPVKNLFLRGEWTYSRILENAGDALQLPSWYAQAQLSYANIWFNGNFDFQVGMEVNYKRPYLAYAYAPSVQQFYLQTQFTTPDFPLLDVFLNAKILRGRIFLRYHNLLKIFFNTGPVPTPFYPGVRNTVDFGFDWSFYD
ncbi:MAG: putative porin [Cyclobacteriaceae bacterium]|nr:putative porin [Cyclobacteriaceae bacterium]